MIEMATALKPHGKHMGRLLGWIGRALPCGPAQGCVFEMRRMRASNPHGKQVGKHSGQAALSALSSVEKSCARVEFQSNDYRGLQPFTIIYELR